MAALSDFYPHILPEVPECPRPLVDFAIRNTLIDFCKETKIWVQALTPVDAVALQMDYALTPPTDTELVRIERVRYDGATLTPKTQDQLDAIYPNGWADLTGTPEYCAITGVDTFSLIPAPTDALTGAIAIRSSLMPSASGAVCPDLILRRYAVQIASGVKAALMLMPEKRWTNADLAEVYGGAYESGRASAMDLAARGQLRVPLRTVANFF